MEKYIEMIIAFGIKLILAGAVLSIGWWIIGRVTKTVEKIMKKRDVDVSLRPFLISIIKISLRIMLIIAVAGMIGIEMTSFIAILGAAGLAIGMALQGSLSNFAGGIIVLLLKPIKVGEYIEVGDIAGTVREIQIFHTYLTTLNKQELIVPNGILVNSAITNYSRHKTRGLNMTFHIDYENDIDEVKKVLKDIVTSQKGYVEDSGHVIKMSELTNKYMNFSIQAWYETKYFWDVYHILPEQVKKRFDAEEISIAHNQIKPIKLIKD